MDTRFKHALMISLVVLMGCSSFNRYTYLPPELKPATIQVEKDNGETAEVDDVCPRMVFSRVPELPPVPLKRIRAARNDQELQEVLLAHIQELRAYAKRVKGQADEQQAQYYTQCLAFQKLKANQH